jgi:hypothetical protein
LQPVQAVLDVPNLYLIGDFSEQRFSITPERRLERLGACVSPAVRK